MLINTQLKILTHLIDNKEQLVGIRELSKKIGVVYYLVQQNVHKLKGKNILTIKKAGKTSVVQISPLINIKYLVKAEEYKKEVFLARNPKIRVIINDIIKESKTKFFSLVIFGSYAKGAQRKNSDLDILVIMPNKKDINTMEKTINNIKHISPVPIHDIIVDEKSFNEMKNMDELNVATEVIKRHVVIYGAEIFCRLQ
ncbi:nucleotidyltransferase domain-containing protein [Candidatus Woesearchaeota archaeon]|nr:nucleotidyltransferase domain-containing protein [Candidatus Woesearchaeota archaeon]